MLFEVAYPQTVLTENALFCSLELTSECRYVQLVAVLTLIKDDVLVVRKSQKYLEIRCLTVRHQRRLDNQRSQRVVGIGT